MLSTVTQLIGSLLTSIGTVTATKPSVAQQSAHDRDSEGHGCTVGPASFAELQRAAPRWDVDWQSAIR